jgi:hypothetical protein
VLCAGHDAIAHTVLAAYFWQPPAPSHLPVLPHVEAAWGGQKAAGAAVPAGASVQVPVPERLQTWQAGHEAEPQQTPSTHMPEVHWLAVAAVQAVPLAFLARHVPPGPLQ